MTEKQEHLLQLFRELDEICKKNNLKNFRKSKPKIKQMEMMLYRFWKIF